MFSSDQENDSATSWDVPVHEGGRVCRGERERERENAWLKDAGLFGEPGLLAMDSCLWDTCGDMFENWGGQHVMVT